MISVTVDKENNKRKGVLTYGFINRENFTEVLSLRHKIKGIFGYGLLIVVFGAIAFFILANYNVLTAEKTTVKVMMKQSEKGLYSAPQYYIYTLSEDTGMSKSSVNQNQLLNIEEYENITGYQMGNGFYTKKGLIKSP